MREHPVVVFRLSGEESERNSGHLARTIRDAGYSPIIVPIFCERQMKSDSKERSLIEGDNLDSVPRLSAFQFRKAFDYELDVFDLSTHSIAIGDVRTDTVLAESVWNQKLRGVASITHQLIDQLNPSAVFVPHGAEVVSRILAVVTARLKKRLLYWESPFFSGYHFVDPVGPHFFRGDCRIDRKWIEPSRPDAGNQMHASDFTQQFRRFRQSKYLQRTASHELDNLKCWVEADYRPVVFVAGQLAHDANVVVSLKRHSDYEHLCRAIIRAVPREWRIVFKPHPLDPTRAKWRSILPEHVLVVDDVDVHDIFTVSNAVATHSSNVGLEAVIMGLPVIVWGTPVYGGKGLTFDISAPEDIGPILAEGHLEAPQEEKVISLVQHILFEGLVREGDGKHLARLIYEAGWQEPPKRLPWYGRPVHSFVAAARALDGELRQSNDISRAIVNVSARQQAEFKRRYGSELMQHRHGGPKVPYADYIECKFNYDLTAAFARSWPERVVLDEGDLQNVIDPEEAVLRAARRVTCRESVAFELRDARSRPSSIQRLTFRDVVRIIRDLRPDLKVTTFGISAHRLTTAPNSTAVFLLRDKSCSEVDRSVVRKLTAEPLRCSKVALSARHFSYLEIPKDFDKSSSFRTETVDATESNALDDGQSPWMATSSEPATTSEQAARDRSETRLVSLINDGHVVFGPHIRIPSGRWKATFRLRIQPPQQHGWLRRMLQGQLIGRRLTIDVCESGSRIIAATEVDFSMRHFPYLDFDANRQSTYEFRVFNHGHLASLLLSFSGVEITPHNRR